MNLIRDNYNEKKQNSSIITGIIVTIVILVVVAGLLIVLVSSLKGKRFKFYVDNAAKPVSQQIFTDVDGVRYVNVKTIAELVGYEYNNGEYNNPYQEDKTKCYVKSDNEIASFIGGSNRMYKVVLDNTKQTEQSNDNGKTDTKGTTTTKQPTTATSTAQTPVTTTTAIAKNINNTEYYELENEVKVINGEIYATEQAICTGFNIYFKYDISKNTVTVLTLPYLVKAYASQEGVALGEECEFSNQKLLLYDMVLVKNSTGEYGVKKLSTGEAVLGTKYAAIKFIESSTNFIVTTEDGKQGISSMSATKIAPQYDELKQLDKDLDLYLVKNDNKYGVINGEDKIVVYIEYDQIGIDPSLFVNNGIDNKYILYNKYIPVKRDGKWGIIGTNGKITLELEYDSFGCIQGPSITKTENNLLLVPESQGLVVCKEGLYGLMTPGGSKLVPTSLTEMYKVTNSGVNTYYMTYNEQKINVVDWIKAKTNATTTTKTSSTQTEPEGAKPTNLVSANSVTVGENN